MFPANAYNAMAMADIAQEKYDDARQQLSKALALQPNDPFFLNNRGYIALVTGDVEGGRKDIDQSIGTDPYNGWAYRNKGIYYLKTHQEKDAIRLFKQAEEMDPFIDRIYAYLGDAYAQAGDKAGACPYYVEAVTRGEMLADKLPAGCR